MGRIFVLSSLFLTIFVLHGCIENQNTLLQDRTLIADQVTKYAELWDRKDADAFSKLFTEDATIEWQLNDGSDQPPAVTGRANILQYAQDTHQGRLAGRQSRHHFSGLVFEELTGRDAVTEHMFMSTHVIPGEKPVVAATGIYRITWRKTDGAWLMAHRKLYVDH
ncbi:MAG: nuclear transport factor 2 family protein [Pseudomonadota bacterium]